MSLSKLSLLELLYCFSLLCFDDDHINLQIEYLYVG